MYQKVSADMNFVDREKNVEKFWKDNDIFKKSMENRKEGETYTFYDGPPTAKGIAPESNQQSSTSGTRFIVLPHSGQGKVTSSIYGL